MGRKKTEAVIENTESSGEVIGRVPSAQIEVTLPQFESLIDRVISLEENVFEEDIGNRLTKLEQRITASDTKYPSNTRDYTVKEGDTLALIAKRELGNAGNLNQIVIMNYDRYPSFRRGIVVEEGWVLRLPPR